MVKVFKTTASSEFPESPYSEMSAGPAKGGTSNAAPRGLSAKPSKSFRILKDAPSLSARGGITSKYPFLLSLLLLVASSSLFLTGHFGRGESMVIAAFIFVVVGLFLYLIEIAKNEKNK